MIGKFKIACFVGAAMFAFSSMPGSSQERGVAGTWSLVSYTTTSKDGTRRNIFDASPKGKLILDANGHYVMILVSMSREKKWTGNRNKASDDELAAAARGLVAQFGRWELADGGKTLVRKLDGGLNPTLDGREERVELVLSGDELKLKRKASRVSGADSEAVYRRVQ